jgi:hypothetical protein
MKVAMIQTARRNARRRLPQSVNDLVAEGGNVLPTDDDLIFAVERPGAGAQGAGARAVALLRLPAGRKAGMSATNTLARPRDRKRAAARPVLAGGSWKGRTS